MRFTHPNPDVQSIGGAGFRGLRDDDGTFTVPDTITPSQFGALTDAGFTHVVDDAPAAPDTPLPIVLVAPGAAENAGDVPPADTAAAE